MYESGYSNGGLFYSMGFLVFWAALYLYVAFSLYKIAVKTNHRSEAWWGFVPILNMFLVLKCANRPWYWFFGMFVPVLNLVLWIVAFVDIAKFVGKNEIWGVLTILPFVNLVALGVLGFGSQPTKIDYQKQQTPTPQHPVGA